MLGCRLDESLHYSVDHFITGFFSENYFFLVDTSTWSLLPYTSDVRTYLNIKFLFQISGYSFLSSQEVTLLLFPLRL